jgi:hypothetical protein
LKRKFDNSVAIFDHEDFINAIKSINGKLCTEIREMSFKFNYQKEILFFYFYPVTSRTGRTVGYELLWMPYLNGIDNCNIEEIELGKGKLSYGEKEISLRDISKILEMITHGIKRIRIDYSI